MGKVVSINLCNFLDYIENISRISTQMKSRFDMTSKGDCVFNNYRVYFKIDDISIVELKALTTMTREVEIVDQRYSNEIINSEKYPEMDQAIKSIWRVREAVKQDFPEDITIDRILPVGCIRYDVIVVLSGISLLNLFDVSPGVVLLDAKFKPIPTDNIYDYFANQIMKSLYLAVRGDAVKSDINANKYIYDLTGGSLNTNIKFLYLHYPMGGFSFSVSGEKEKSDYIRNISNCKKYFSSHDDKDRMKDISLSISMQMEMRDILNMEIYTRTHPSTDSIPSFIPSYVEMETPYYLVKYATTKQIQLSEEILKIYQSRISDVVNNYYKNRESLRKSTNDGTDDFGRRNDGYGYMKELLLSGEKLDINCVGTPKRLLETLDECNSDDIPEIKSKIKSLIDIFL